MMQHVACPPPYGSTQEAIDAFKPIRRRRSTKTPGSRAATVQQDQLAVVLPMQTFQPMPGSWRPRAYGSTAACSTPTTATARTTPLRPCDRTARRRSHRRATRRAQPGRANRRPLSTARSMRRTRQAARLRPLANPVETSTAWIRNGCSCSWRKYGPLDWRPGLAARHLLGDLRLPRRRRNEVRHHKEFQGLKPAHRPYSLKDLCWGGPPDLHRRPEYPDAPPSGTSADPALCPVVPGRARRRRRAGDEGAHRVKQENFIARHINLWSMPSRCSMPLPSREAAKLPAVHQGHLRHARAEWDLDVENFIIGPPE